MGFVGTGAFLLSEKARTRDSPIRFMIISPSLREDVVLGASGPRHQVAKDRLQRSKRHADFAVARDCLTTFPRNAVQMPRAEALTYTRNHRDVHLIDGTYELFRHFCAVPAAQDVNDREIGAVPAVLRSVLSMIEHGASHIGVATIMS